MNAAIEYWYVIIALVVLLIIAGGAIYAFFKQPSSKQLQKVKEWLLFAVIEAEKELGSGTGRIKLRFVYDLFISKFKWTAYLITFETFSLLVDDALDEMRDMLRTNHSVHALVSGEVTFYDH